MAAREALSSRCACSNTCSIRTVHRNLHAFWRSMPLFADRNTEKYALDLEITVVGFEADKPSCVLCRSLQKASHDGVCFHSESGESAILVGVHREGTGGFRRRLASVSEDTASSGLPQAHDKHHAMARPTTPHTYLQIDFQDLLARVVYPAM